MLHNVSGYIATLLRPAALQKASVAENRKTSPALGLTGGECNMNIVETAGYHMLLSGQLPRF